MFSRRFSLTISSVLLIAVYVVNATLGQSLGDLAVIFPFDIMPPGVSFGIARSLIYTALGAMLVYLWFSRYDWTKIHQRFHLLFWISCFINMGWIISTRAQMYALSVIVIISLFVVLWLILSTILDNQDSRGKMKFWVSAPIALYLSWIMAASSVIGTSQAVFLFDANFATGLIWQLIALSLGLITGLFAWYRFHYDIVELLFLWALGGIAIKNMTDNPALSLLSIFGIVVFATLISRNMIRKNR